MTKKEKRDHILARLDELYGTEKEGFYHNADWQLLVAIMLSAQSTDKQVCLLYTSKHHFGKILEVGRAV